eukprot:7257189-Prymnesium_polylepis.1
MRRAPLPAGRPRAVAIRPRTRGPRRNDVAAHVDPRARRKRPVPVAVVEVDDRIHFQVDSPTYDRIAGFTE